MFNNEPDIPTALKSKSNINFQINNYNSYYIYNQSGKSKKFNNNKKITNYFPTKPKLTDADESFESENFTVNNNFNKTSTKYVSDLFTDRVDEAEEEDEEEVFDQQDVGFQQHEESKIRKPIFNIIFDDIKRRDKILTKTIQHMTTELAPDFKVFRNKKYNKAEKIFNICKVPKMVKESIQVVAENNETNISEVKNYNFKSFDEIIFPDRDITSDSLSLYIDLNNNEFETEEHLNYINSLDYSIPLELDLGLNPEPYERVLEMNNYKIRWQNDIDDLQLQKWDVIILFNSSIPLKMLLKITRLRTF
jgi:hypothetical protein